MKNSSVVFKIGILAGFLFFLHALIPNSHAWPLIWPFLAGIFLMVYLKNKINLENYLQAAKPLLKVGLISAGIFFVFTLLVLLLLNIPVMEGVSEFLSAEGPVVINSSVVVGLLIAAGLGIVLSMLSGSVLYPFLKK